MLKEIAMLLLTVQGMLSYTENSDNTAKWLTHKTMHYMVNREQIQTWHIYASCVILYGKGTQS